MHIHFPLFRYHVPGQGGRAYLKPTDNLLVLFEETGGNPDGVLVKYVSRDTINDYHPPHVNSWERKNSKIRAVVDDMKPKAHLKCPNYKKITAVEFASFGNAAGVCGNFTMGNCTAPTSQTVVEKYCLGKTDCSIPIEQGEFVKENEPLCPEYLKYLSVQVRCEH